MRFREIRDYKNIDLLFLGSSHSYRSFDTRLFTDAGYTSFNLGSALQTPFNSYYLLREYFDQLKPKVVILSVEDYLKNVIKQPKILTTIQLSAQKAGLDKMSDREIEAEITSYRRSKIKK